MEQPRQWPVEGPARRRPGENTHLLGAREGDVERAHLFGAAFGDGPRAQGLGLARAQIEDGPAHVVMAAVGRLIGPAAPRAQPGRIGHEHDGELEALGLVHGRDLDQIGVVLQAQAVRLTRLAVLDRRLDGALEPAHETVHTEHLVLRRLEALDEMEVVGEAALAVGECGDARGRGLDHGLGHREDAVARPAQVRLLEGLAPRGPALLVGVEGGDVAQALAEQRRGQGQAQALAIVGHGGGAQ